MAPVLMTRSVELDILSLNILMVIRPKHLRPRNYTINKQRYDKFKSVYLDICLVKTTKQSEF